jgi:predicted extracellular nuclease
MEALSITPNLELPAADLERFYGDMVRIRRFEERVTELFKARRRSRSAPAPICARTTTSPAIIAATATASPRVRAPTA